MLPPIHCTVYIQGLKLGSITEASPILRYRAGQCNQEASCKRCTAKDGLINTLRLIMQDRWQSDTSDENVALRCRGCELSARLADFARFVVRSLHESRKDSYVTLHSRWCSRCSRYVSHLGGDTSSRPFVSYRCLICRHSDFDLCSECYDKGETWEGHGHTLIKLPVPCVWIPFNDDVFEVLERYAPNGRKECFNKVLYLITRSVSFFEASTGLRGTAYVAIEPEDTVVVLSGSRLPYILRRTGNMYRLISGCYI
jgi:hypothetical protein